MSDGTLAHRFEELAGKHVLILGDVMLDRFVYGTAGRISPEAPVPVLSIQRETIVPGGAANVARNVAALGGTATLIGLIGEDEAGGQLTDALEKHPGIRPALLRVKDRPTTRKIRFVADRQQVIRADYEDRAAIGKHTDALLNLVHKHLPEADAVVLSDYAKGLLSERVIGEVIAAARGAGKPVIVDPKGKDVRRYDGATVITPNLAEGHLASGIDGTDDQACQRIADAILVQAPRLSAVLLTRGPLGMMLRARAQESLFIATAAREVFDVSGAGDTVVATLALAMAGGLDLAVAARLGNSAAGLAVAKLGTAAVTAEEMLVLLEADQPHAGSGKILTRARAAALTRTWQSEGKRVGFTNGCFDLLHPGHVALLEQARRECDRLVVGLNTDASVRKLKGPTRPVQDERSRAIVMAALSVVDAVVLFKEDTPLALIEALRPDLLVKGADYSTQTVVGADLVQSYGGKVMLASLVEGQSTTRLLARRDGTGAS